MTKRILLLLLLSASLAGAQVHATMQWECRPAGTTDSTGGGGGFKPGASGTDYSLQNAVQYNLTGVTTAGVDNILLTASAATDMVGNTCRVVSGVNVVAGIYEITAVTAGVSITVDRNCATGGAMSGGIVNIGGAYRLSSTLDDDWFEAGAAGNTYWIKSGTYTVGEVVGIALAGTATAPIRIIGYNATRGDDPTGSGRPLLNMGAVGFTPGTRYKIYYLSFIGNQTPVFTAGATTDNFFVKVVNNSTTVNRLAFQTGGGLTFGCEAVSYRGTAFYSTGSMYLVNCHAHDSNIGVGNAATSGQGYYGGNIFANCATAAMNFTGTTTGTHVIVGNTLYGAESTEGTGLSLVAGSSRFLFYNNIVCGFTTGVSHPSANKDATTNWNNYYNNTADVNDVLNWQKGENDLALDPQFADVGQVTFATATTSGSVITQSGADFAAAGVVVGDYVYLASGTGVVQMSYNITAVGTTTLTVDIAPGTNATADKVGRITIGNNFAVGTNLKALAYPGVFPNGKTTGYTDIGGVQRQEAGGGGGETSHTYAR